LSIPRRAGATSDRAMTTTHWPPVAASSLSQRGRALAGSLAASGIEGEAPMLIESLTPREHQVLRYLPRPLTNEEIAAEMFVSLNTVKTHLKSVYRKLGATSRSEVVDRARTLDLL
jgi:LuxR family transcriptional regulator, maltose regulon positive regulatory protein